MIVSYEEYEKFDKDYGHLFYQEPYSHYIIAVEYRFVGKQSPGGPLWGIRNSGVIFHSQSPESMEKDQDFPISVEMQLLGGNGDKDSLRSTGNSCTPGTKITLADISPDSILALQHQTERSPFPMGECAKAFAPQAVEDAAHRARDHFDCNVILSDSENWETTIRDWVMANDLDSIVTSRLAVGPVKDRLRRAMVNIETPLIEVDNPYDRAVWPHATKGFFKLKKKIPIIVSDLGLS